MILADKIMNERKRNGWSQEELAEKLCDISKIPLLRAKLHEKGLSETLLDKIFYKNAENYLETFDKRR